EPIRHSLLEIFQHAGLASRHANRQCLAIRYLELNDVSAVRLRAVDHDPVSATLRCHAHLRRSFDQSSSASRFTSGASAFFILSQSGERPERYGESLRFETMPSSPSLQAW